MEHTAERYAREYKRVREAVKLLAGQAPFVERCRLLLVEVHGARLMSEQESKDLTDFIGALEEEYVRLPKPETAA